MVRCFIAIDTSTSSLAYHAKRIQDAFKENNIRASFQNPHTLHITMKFLGEVDEGRIEEIKVLLNKITGEPFRIRVSGVGAFPNLRRPRVIFFAIDKSDPLLDIHRQIEDLMSKIGFPREIRSFKPHITLMRVKFPRSLSSKLHNFLFRYDFQESIDITDVRLKRSTLTPSGAIYDDLHVVPLRGSR
jgi:2'-5' RNA ligase